MSFYTFMPTLLNMSLTASVAIAAGHIAAPASEKSTQGHFLCVVGVVPIQAPVSGIDWFRLLRI